MKQRVEIWKSVVLGCLATAATTRPAAADDHAQRSLHMREPTRTSQTAPAPAASQLSPAPDDGVTEVIDIHETSSEHERFTGRAPTSVLSRADLIDSGRATLGDILQAIPSQGNASNAQDNAHGNGATRVNLRGLGASRTLVLLNGRRIGNGGNGADDAVDLNTVPLAMVERIEVEKDGGSTLYGADAIGGVVNIITRAPFNGVDVSVLSSTSQRGDGTEYDASAVGGLATADKQTYLILAAGYQHHDPVFARNRAFSEFQNSYDFASKTARPYLSPITGSGRLDTASLGGVQPPGCTSQLCKPVGDGTWANLAPGGGDNEAAGNYLYTPSSRYSVAANLGNRLNDNMSMFAEAQYLFRRSGRELSPVTYQGDVTLSKDSIENPFGVDLVGYQRRLVEAGPRHDGDKVTMTRVVAGVTGDFPAAFGALKGWQFEASVTHSSTDAARDDTGQLNKHTLGDALGPSMLDENGAPICVKVPGDASTKIVYITHNDYVVIKTPCVPLNIFAPAGKITAAQLLSLTREDIGVGNDTLDTVVGTVHGRIAELPDHGEITLTLGTDYRREAGDTDPPSATTAPDYSSDTSAERSNYHFQLYEGFGDLAIVPITGHDLAKRVELDLGARALDYSRYGSELTYKLGGLFRTVAGITARGTYSTAIRAPSIFELGGGRTETLVAAEDPCDAGPPSVGDGARTLSPTVQARCAAQGVPAGARFGTAVQSAFTGGNTKLRPETAATATIGVVVEPPPIPGLAISADYWHITIDDAVEHLGVPLIFANCYDRGIQAFCDQIQRADTTHQLVAIDQPLQNVDRTTTSGLDLAVMYDTRLPGELGRVHAALEGQYLFDYDLVAANQTIHGAGYYDLGVYPHYKANLSGRWSQPGGASGGLSLRYVGGYQECAGNDCNLADNRATAHDVDRYVKLDVFGGYDVRSRIGLTSLQLGVNNVFDATPPVIYNATAANSDATAYDFLGRMVYLRLSHQY